MTKMMIDGKLYVVDSTGEKSPERKNVTSEFAAIGRGELISMVQYFRGKTEEHERTISELETSIVDQNESYISVLAELAALKENLVIKGWTCRQCGVFNGEEKELRVDCRSCGLTKHPSND